MPAASSISSPKCLMSSSKVISLPLVFGATLAEAFFPGIHLVDVLTNLAASLAAFGAGFALAAGLAFGTGLALAGAAAFAGAAGFFLADAAPFLGLAAATVLAAERSL